MKRSSQKVFIILTVILTVTLISYGVYWFQHELKQRVTETTETYLFENANLYASAFATKLNDQLMMLESQARYFENIDMTDYNQMKNAISATKGVGEFKTIAVANSAGTTLNYNLKSSGNIMMKDYFITAMKGKTDAASNIETDEDGDEVMVLAVPILQNGEPAGVITGTFKRDILKDLFALDTFSGEGYIFIINSEGDIIIKSSNTNMIMTNDNYFDGLSGLSFENGLTDKQIIQNIKSGKKSIAYYNYKGMERIAVYYPIGVHDWYIISVVPSDVITSQSMDITVLVWILIAIIIIAFSILIYILFLFYRRNVKISRTNERYKIVNEQNQNVIFEYNIEEKKLDISGNTKFVFGVEPSIINTELVSILNSRVHRDDVMFWEHMNDFINGNDTTFSSEARFLCEDNLYYWFRLQATLVRDSHGKQIKFIGTLTNVNEQITKERSLKKKPEYDALTGILNKSTLEETVEEALAAANEEDIHALFMIDLDNFKEINIKFGHSLGDNVLMETTNKLSLIFSEQDILGRIGGDEFVAFLKLSPEGQKTAMKIIEAKGKNICEILKNTYSDGNHEVSLSASVGIAVFSKDGRSYEGLYYKADRALYYSKKSGKNQFHLYEDFMEGDK